MTIRTASTVMATALHVNNTTVVAVPRAADRRPVRQRQRIVLCSRNGVLRQAGSMIDAEVLLRSVRGEPTLDGARQIQHRAQRKRRTGAGGNIALAK